MREAPPDAPAARTADGEEAGSPETIEAKPRTAALDGVASNSNTPGAPPHPANNDLATPPPPGSIERGADGHPEIVRHAAAAFKARVTGVVRKTRGG